jgi:hypothetical protein
VVEAHHGGGDPDDARYEGEEDEEAGGEVADGEEDRVEMRGKPQLRADDEAAVDGHVQSPPADDGQDDVHAQVQEQQQQSHGLDQVVGHVSSSLACLLLRTCLPLVFIYDRIRDCLLSTYSYYIYAWYILICRRRARHGSYHRSIWLACCLGPSGCKADRSYPS